MFHPSTLYLYVAHIYQLSAPTHRPLATVFTSAQLIFGFLWERPKAL